MQSYNTQAWGSKFLTMQLSRVLVASFATLIASSPIPLPASQPAKYSPSLISVTNVISVVESKAKVLRVRLIHHPNAFTNVLPSTTVTCRAVSPHNCSCTNSIANMKNSMDRRKNFWLHSSINRKRTSLACSCSNSILIETEANFLLTKCMLLPLICFSLFSIALTTSGGVGTRINKRWTSIWNQATWPIC